MEEAVRFGDAAKANWVEGTKVWLVMVRLTAGDQETAFAPLGGAAALTSIVEAGSAPPRGARVLAYSATRGGDVDEAERRRAEATLLGAPIQARVLTALVSSEIA